MEAGTQQPQTPETKPPAPVGPGKLLDLAAERTARLRFGKQTFIHVFRPLTLADWEKYARRAAGAVIEHGDKSYSVESHTEEAAWELWEAACVDVRGYTGKGEDWKSKMDFSHREWAVALLQEVRATDIRCDFLGEGGAYVVQLEAGWNGGRYEQLAHTLRAPTADERLRYRRAEVRFQRVGGQRKQATRILVPVKLRTLCELSDAMVLGVEGYAGYAGPASMDALHKQAAVEAVFNPAAFNEPEEEEIQP